MVCSDSETMGLDSRQRFITITRSLCYRQCVKQMIFFLLGGSHGLLETEQIHVLLFSIQATAKSKYTFGKKSGGYIFWLTRQQKQFLVSGNMNSHND